MKLTLYTTEYRNQISPEMLRRLLDQLPAEIQRKALRYRRWQDVYGCIFGHHLLSIAIGMMDFSGNLDHLQYSPEKKPFLPGGPLFNISHSATRVVCLVSNEKKVGIDIEYIDESICLGDFRGQFTDSEWSVIQRASYPKNIFYQLWTAKESILKADGRGLSISLHRIDVSKRKPVLLDGNTWSFTRLPFFEGYECHLSTEEIPETDPRISSKSLLSSTVDFELYQIMPNDFAY